MSTPLTRPGPERWRSVGAVVLLGLLAAPLWRPLPQGQARDKPARPLPAALATAIRNGDVKAIRAQLDGGVPINARDADGNTPLILAALYAGPDVIQLLLDRKADVHAVNTAGVTALVRAATHYDKARLLVAAGARVEVKTKIGNTPLMLAARRYGNSATVRLLLDKGADVKARNRHGSSAIHAAAASGDLETVRLLLDRGADVDDARFVADDEDNVRTPLMWAAFRNDVPMLKLLLQRKADPNKGVKFGTPLTHAAWHDSVEAAELLLKSGARVNTPDEFAGFTPLHWATAIDSPRAGLVKLLLAHRANPNAQGGEKIDAYLTVPQTPLMLARLRGDTAAVRALLAHGATGVPPAKPVATPRRKLPERLSQAMLRSATERAVAVLQETAATSREAFLRHASRQDCVSCHQQFLPMAAVGHAREKGVRLDRKAAQKQIDLVQQLAHKAGDVFFLAEYGLQALFHPEPVHAFGYQAFALLSEKVPPGFLTDGPVHHLATIQAADGGWYVNLPRPPLQAGDVSATALALLAIKNHGWRGRQAEFDQAVERGRQWLWRVKAQTTEDAVYQLLGLHWAGEPATKLAPLARTLAGRQRDDGGWSQLEKLPSDAYATGQVLYALARAARHSVSDPVWQRGVRFLLATQHELGSWHVRRRAFPFQPTMPSGFPHQRDAWISASGTSWAVLALTQALKPGTTTEQPPATRKPPEKGVAKTTTKVDFVRHIKPVLERSCVACHGPMQQRSAFRVDRRETLIKAGSSGVPAVVPHQSARSPLLDHVSGRVEEMEMPPIPRRGRYPALSKEEIALLRAWIDQGAVWPTGVVLTPPRDDRPR